MDALGPVSPEIADEHPEGEEPEQAHRGVGQDENAGDDEGVDGRRIEQSGIEAGLGVFDFLTDPVDDIGVCRHEYHGGQADEKLAVEPQVEAEKLDDPAHHARVVEVAPVGEQGIGPVVGFVVAELHPGGQDATDDKAHKKEPGHGATSL